MRIAILTQFPSPSVQSGPAIHVRFLYEGFRKRGHHVVLVGPDTNSMVPIDADVHLFKGFSYPTHPGVKITLPAPLSTLLRVPDVDLIHSQTPTHLNLYGNWIRRQRQIPVVNTHTVHLPTHSHFILSDRLYDNDLVRQLFQQAAANMEFNFAKSFNDGDALIVQSRHFVEYWRDRGVTVPIHVIGRPINPALFSKQPEGDPFPAHFKTGKRLVCVCRHDREKRLDHLIDIFTRHIAPADDDATLTLVGDGKDHDNLAAQVARSPFADRIHFPGEAVHANLVDWYSHADVFVYTSLSETFGNVINEALWCGLPVVALDDRMGVAHQVVDEVNGFLLSPNRTDTDERFAAYTLLLANNRTLRRQLGEEAANLSRRNSHPDIVLRRLEEVYAQAIHHVREHVPVPLSQQSRLAQLRGFTRYMGSWVGWNVLLLAVAHTFTRLGGGRADSQIHREIAAPFVRQPVNGTAVHPHRIASSAHAPTFER